MSTPTPTTTPDTVWFEDLGRDDTAIAGGKGANLGEMTRAGLPVPPGFVVTAAAYHRFLDAAGLRDGIAGTLAALDVDDHAALEAASVAIQRAVREAPVPPDLRDAVAAAYRDLGEQQGQDDVPVAVRSSATMEDTKDASFAGMNRSFLNVTGEAALADAVREVWASLYSPRVVFYRGKMALPGEPEIAVIVQAMVDADTSGVAFSVDPASGDPGVIVIEAAFGLGEVVVAGQVEPDHYVVEKDGLAIRQARIGYKKFLLTRGPDGRNRRVDLSPERADRRVLTDDQVRAVAELVLRDETHYGSPQDTEWAFAAGRLYLLQSRPVTTAIAATSTPSPTAVGEGAGGEGRPSGPGVLAGIEATPPATSSLTHRPSPAAAGEGNEPVPPPASRSLPPAMALVRGLGASPGTASGAARIVLDPHAADALRPGDILVAEMTSPNWVPYMRRAGAIVTERGGVTSHAAIVSRELGVPCVVGARGALTAIADGQEVTVDGAAGVVLAGTVEQAAAPTATATATPATAPTAPAILHAAPVTATKLMVNLGEPERAREVAALPVDGVGLLRAEFMLLSALEGVHPRRLLAEGRGGEFADRMEASLRVFADAFWPRPVIYRSTDFRTNEFRGLQGGEAFEPLEDNPMIGVRGAWRSLRDPELFALELEALTRVRAQRPNLQLMIPFVRTAREMTGVARLVAESGLMDQRDFQLWVMAEVPSIVHYLDAYAALGVAGVSIGSNDLTQLVLGIDRDNDALAPLFDERDPAVVAAIGQIVAACRRLGLHSSICGQAPSTHPEYAELLVRMGIDSISVNPDAVDVTRRTIAAAEQRLLLDAARAAVTRDAGSTVATAPLPANVPPFSPPPSPPPPFPS